MWGATAREVVVSLQWGKRGGVNYEEGRRGGGGGGKRMYCEMRSFPA